MDSYYSSLSYYYEPSCPLHDSYSSYYYPSYTDQSFSVYNNSPTNIYAQPTPSVEVAHSTPILNTTFETTPPKSRRRRRQRTIFSKDQVDILDHVFEKNRYPDIELREQLSQQLDVPEARIQVWFKNRRSRVRTAIKSKN